MELTNKSRKETVIMASLKKYIRSHVLRTLKHNLRTANSYLNQDIDFSKSCDNYQLFSHACSNTDKPLSPYEYFKSRLSEVYVHNRKDVKVLAEWVITLPQEIDGKDDEIKFFKTCVDFLSERYGYQNRIDATVHVDEVVNDIGQPHLHFTFIPCTSDDNPKHKECDKVCASEILSKFEYRTFHTDLQGAIDAAKIKANVVSGITKSNGGNKSVRELKLETRIMSLERELEREREYNRELERNMTLIYEQSY
jgi:Plasmid recombination enzyme.